MDNANTKEYLDKIRNQVVENLKRTAFAPSVQITDVPRDPLVEGMDDEADAIMDDLDDDENKDKRFTKRRFDQYIQKTGELSDSEDEEENAANGVRRQPGVARRRNQINYRNRDILDSGLDSGIATPGDASSVPGEDEDMDLTADGPIDQVEDLPAEEPAEAEIAAKADEEDAAPENQEAAPAVTANASSPMTSANSDAHSDVDMEDADAPSREPEQSAPIEAVAAQEKTPPASPPAEEPVAEEPPHAERPTSPAATAPQSTEAPVEETLEAIVENPAKEDVADESGVKAEEQEKEDTSESKEPAKTEE
jgi:histone deacetylase 1/2